MAMVLKQNNIKGKIFGIEHVKQLVEKSIQNVRKSNADLIEEGYLILLGMCVISLSYYTILTLTLVISLDEEHLISLSITHI
jgi:hypothetical protein